MTDEKNTGQLGLQDLPLDVARNLHALLDSCKTDRLAIVPTVHKPTQKTKYIVARFIIDGDGAVVGLLPLAVFITDDDVLEYASPEGTEIATSPPIKNPTHLH